MSRPFYLKDPSNEYYLYMIGVYPCNLPNTGLQDEIRTLLTLQESSIVPQVEVVWTFNGYTYIGMQKCFPVQPGLDFHIVYREEIQRIYETLERYNLRYTGQSIEADVCLDQRKGLRLLSCASVQEIHPSDRRMLTLFHPVEQCEQTTVCTPLVLFATHRAGEPTRFGPFVGEAILELPIPPHHVFVHPLVSPFPRRRE